MHAVDRRCCRAHTDRDKCLQQISLSIWSVATVEARETERGKHRVPIHVGGLRVSELVLFFGFMALTAVAVVSCQVLFELGGLWFRCVWQPVSESCTWAYVIRGHTVPVPPSLPVRGASAERRADWLGPHTHTRTTHGRLMGLGGPVAGCVQPDLFGRETLRQSAQDPEDAGVLRAARRRHQSHHPRHPREARSRKLQHGQETP